MQLAMTVKGDNKLDAALLIIYDLYVICNAFRVCRLIRIKFMKA